MKTERMPKLRDNAARRILPPSVKSILASHAGNKKAQALGLSMSAHGRKGGGDPRARIAVTLKQPTYLRLASAFSASDFWSEAAERIVSNAIVGEPARGAPSAFLPDSLPLIEDTSPASTPPFSISMSP